MATIEWLRLWHDMPNDPKWRSVARVSGQPLTLVLSVAIHLFVDASRNVTRGHITVTPEDVASALDAENDAVEAVFKAMQGRVLDGDLLTGWEKRQVKREEKINSETGVSASYERKKKQREKEKVSRTLTQSPSDSDGVTHCHAVSEKFRLDTDTDTDTDISPSLRSGDSVFSDEKTAACAAKNLPNPASPLSKSEVWKAAVSLLATQGMDGSQARAFVGMLAKKLGGAADQLQSIVEAAVAEQPADARAWLLKAAQARARPPGSPPEPDWLRVPAGPDWWTPAGFPTHWEAEAAGCTAKNSSQFRAGKRIEKTQEATA